MVNMKTDERMDSMANRYALHCFCITMAAFGVAWLMNQLNIFIIDKRLMNMGFAMAMILFAVCLVICRLAGLERPSMKYILLFFIIAVTTVIETMITYHAVILSVIPIIYSAMYRNTKRMTIYTYLMTIVSVIIIVFVGYRFGLCDANMALLTREPLAHYVTDGRFLADQLNPNPVLTLSLYFVFPRCVLCGVFVPICINISRIIARSRLKEEEMRVLAEIDRMTGLYNRSKYLEQVSNPYAAEEKLAVIFWDINGLKKINDTLGHEYGDQLILAVSESIREAVSASDKAYRIGGDEFVMILRGGDEESVRRKIRAWEDSIRGKTVGNGIPVSAACGYACGAGSDLEEIIRRADESMYAKKRAYYEERA